MARRKQPAQQGPVTPAQRLLTPYVEAFVNPDDYETRDDARVAAHGLWVQLCREHNSRAGDVIRTPILNDYKFYEPADFPFAGEDLWSPWP